MFNKEIMNANWEWVCYWKMEYLLGDVLPAHLKHHETCTKENCNDHDSYKLFNKASKKVILEEWAAYTDASGLCIDEIDSKHIAAVPELLRCAQKLKATMAVLVNYYPDLWELFEKAGNVKALNDLKEKLK